MACDALSEIRAVQEGVGELQRGEPHGPRALFSHLGFFYKSLELLLTWLRRSPAVRPPPQSLLLRHCLTSAWLVGPVKAVVVGLLLDTLGVCLGAFLLVGFCQFKQRISKRGKV